MSVSVWYAETLGERAFSRISVIKTLNRDSRTIGAALRRVPSLNMAPGSPQRIWLQ